MEYDITNVTEEELLEETELAQGESEAKPFSEAVMSVLFAEAKKNEEEEMDDEDEDKEDEEEMSESKKSKTESEDEDEDEDKVLDEANMPKTKAGILNAAFDQMKGMKKHELTKAYGEINMSEGEGEEMPKLKADIINAMYDGMKKMNKENIMAAYNSLMASCSAGHDMKESNEEFAHDLSILVENEANLTEDFRKKASVLFEAAVANRVADIRESLEKKYNDSLTEEVTYVRDTLVEQVDTYLTYVVENWMSENKVFVEKGLRTEIAENFMTSLKNLFVENYIEIPVSKVDAYDRLSEEVESETHARIEAEERVNELTEQVNSLLREKVLSSVGSDLTSTQLARFRRITEEVEFSSEESFTEKVETIKESYFSSKSNSEADVLVEDIVSDDTKIIVEGEVDHTEKLPADMKAYLRALSSINQHSHR